MAVIRGMFGAPVFLPEAPDVVNDQAKLSVVRQRDQELAIEAERQQSLAQNRETLAGIKGQNAINGRLQALIQLAPDNPDMATQFLNEDTELQRAFNIRPGQMKFEGRRGQATVVRDLYGGRTLLINPYEKDPAKRIIAEVGTTPPPATESQMRAGAFSRLSPEEQAAAVRDGKKSTRARTKAELAQAAINGDEEAAQILAETGGLTGFIGSLTRRATGAGVTDPSVKGLSPAEAKRRLAELGKLDAVKALTGAALLGGGGGGAGGEEPGGGSITVRNPETGEEFEGPASAGVPDGYELVED